MKLANVYEKIVELQEIAWRGDDLMEQEDLIELQSKIAKLALELANYLGKVSELAKKFPWLYKISA